MHGATPALLKNVLLLILSLWRSVAVLAFIIRIRMRVGVMPLWRPVRIAKLLLLVHSLVVVGVMAGGLLLLN
tara:strand:- start:128 stop:343 length:216 start_codon:yes stop_codon:yes gene_type:complete